MANSALAVPAEKVSAAILFMSQKVRTRFLSDDAAEGLAAYMARRSNGEQHLDELHSAVRASSGGDELADASLESVAEALGKSYKRGGDPPGFNRVDDAVDAARHGNFRGSARAAVLANIGPDKPFKTMEEFEALRFVHPQDMRPEQVAAMVSIRASVEGVGVLTPIKKYISLSDAQKYINGEFEPKVRGFIVKSDDVADLVGAPRSRVRESMRLDRPGGPFEMPGGYAVIEVPEPSADLIINSRVPKTDGYWAGGNDRYVVEPFPYVGDGFVASKDGYLRSEFHLGGEPGIAMPLGTRIKKHAESGELVGEFVLSDDPSGVVFRQIYP